MEQSDVWRKCSSCKGPIPFNKVYWVCSVSTCNRQRTDLVFCKVSCFDAHVPMFNHRDAGAFERRSPTADQWKSIQEQAAAKPAGAPGGTPRAPRAPAPERTSANEILVVASKVKEYIRSRSGGMNTSASVMDALSDKVRAMADEGIRSATQHERKTVLDRDIK